MPHLVFGAFLNRQSMLLPLRIRTHISCEETLHGSVQWKIILDNITILTQITGRGGPGDPCCGLKARNVNAQPARRLLDKLALHAS